MSSIVKIDGELYCQTPYGGVRTAWNPAVCDAFAVYKMAKQAMHKADQAVSDTHIALLQARGKKTREAAQSAYSQARAEAAIAEQLVIRARRIVERATGLNAGDVLSLSHYAPWPWDVVTVGEATQD